MRGLTPAYVARRLGMLLLTVWFGATLIFVVSRLAPGDPASAMVNRLTSQGATVSNSTELIARWRHEFGLDEPVLVQYLEFLRHMATFDFGYSLSRFPVEVQSMVGRALPWTIGLLTLSTIVSFLLGNVVGALLGWRRSPRWLRATLPFSLVFTSIPFYMVALLLIYFFAFGFGLLPSSGAYDGNLTPALDGPFVMSVLEHGLLPSVSIVITSMGFWAIGMRGMMITFACDDYRTYARARGLRPARIFFGYAVRNALLPQFTALTLSLGSVIAGSVLVEYVFAYPGTGYLLYQGISESDYTLIQGVVFILIVTTALMVFVLDLLYPLLDPRISYRKS